MEISTFPQTSFSWKMSYFLQQPSLPICKQYRNEVHTPDEGSSSRSAVLGNIWPFVVEVEDSFFGMLLLPPASISEIKSTN